MNTRTITVNTVHRLHNSVNGNPRFELYADEGVFLTSSDSACNYDVENMTRHLPATLVVTLTKAGRVQQIKGRAFTATGEQLLTDK